MSADVEQILLNHIHNLTTNQQVVSMLQFLDAYTINTTLRQACYEQTLTINGQRSEGTNTNETLIGAFTNLIKKLATIAQVRAMLQIIDTLDQNSQRILKPSCYEQWNKIEEYNNRDLSEPESTI